MIGKLIWRLRSGPTAGIGAGAIFIVLYITAASSVFFALGLIAEQALGLTPFVFIAASVFFGLTLMSYAEGSSLHTERGGASSFARYAFDEFWSFVAGWAILLDYVIVLALVASAIPNYLSVFWHPLGDHLAEMVIPVAVITAAVVLNVRGISVDRLRKSLPIGAVDLVVQLGVIVIGIILVWSPSALVDTISFGKAPTWGGLAVAMILATVAGTGLEVVSGLAGEVQIGRRSLRRVVVSAVWAVSAIYVGMATIALMAVPVSIDINGVAQTELATTYVENPVVGIAAGMHPHWLSQPLVYLIGIVATITLIEASRFYVLGPMRLSSALATHRQIPGFFGRIHNKYGTPYVAAIFVGLLASALAITDNPEFLISIYAFGALLTFAIANLAICVLRYREPNANPAFKVPFSVKIGPGLLPLPSAIAFLASITAWVGVLIFRPDATIVGVAWMVFGVVLYVIYRSTQGKSLRHRVVVPEQDLRSPSRRGSIDVTYGSILVPVFGGVLDDDIVGTAGRLAMDEVGSEGGSMIEALHVIEIPLSQPLDGPVPDDRLARARRVLARAKEVGEEYAGVEVATATVRARSTGEAIVREAARRGVELIVLAAERPSRIRGGPLLGGVEPRAAEFVGKVSEYVARNAPCRVVLTAPPEMDSDALAESIRQNPHLSAEFAAKEHERLTRGQATSENDLI